MHPPWCPVSRRRDYAAEARRRDQLARERGFRSYGQQRRYGNAVRTGADYGALPQSARERRKTVLRAVDTARREKITVNDVLAREQLPTSAATWWAANAVTVSRKGVIRPTRGDRMLRVVPVFADGRLQVLTVRGSNAAATATAAFVAQVDYIDTGLHPEDLDQFRGKRVGGQLIETDLAILDELGRQGALSELGEEYRAVLS